MEKTGAQILVRVDDTIGYLADESTDLEELYSRELKHYEALSSYLKARNRIIQTN